MYNKYYIKNNKKNNIKTINIYIVGIPTQPGLAQLVEHLTVEVY